MVDAQDHVTIEQDPIRLMEGTYGLPILEIYRAALRCYKGAKSCAFRFAETSMCLSENISQVQTSYEERTKLAALVRQVSWLCCIAGRTLEIIRRYVAVHTLPRKTKMPASSTSSAAIDGASRLLWRFLSPAPIVLLLLLDL